MTWSTFKQAIAAQFPVAHDVLHVHFGLAIFLGIAAIYRFSRRGLVVGWLVLLALELLNEFLDLSPFGGSIEEATLFECGKDLINTMLWPTVLWAVFWVLSKRRAPPRAKGHPQPGARLRREPDVSNL